MRRNRYFSHLPIVMQHDLKLSAPTIGRFLAKHKKEPLRLREYPLDQRLRSVK